MSFSCNGVETSRSVARERCSSLFEKFIILGRTSISQKNFKQNRHHNFFCKICTVYCDWVWY